MLSQLLSRFGLVRSARYRAMEDRAHKLERRVDALLKDQEGIRKDTQTWKKKASDLAKSLRDAQKELRRQTSKIEKFRIQAEQDQAKLSEGNERARRRQETQSGEHSVELAALKDRLSVAQREVVVAREQLMAVEVKLDILEGAANVLDLRTREIVARRDAQAETTV